MRTIEEIVVLVCKHLNEHEIPYVIVGGIVIPFVGAPRTTVDVDLIIKLSSDNMARLIGFFASKRFSRITKGHYGGDIGKVPLHRRR